MQSKIVIHERPCHRGRHAVGCRYAVLAAIAFALSIAAPHARAQATAGTRTANPPAAAQKQAPAQPPAKCPDGSEPEHRDTPFGRLDVCPTAPQTNATTAAPSAPQGTTTGGPGASQSKTTPSTTPAAPATATGAKPAPAGAQAQTTGTTSATSGASTHPGGAQPETGKPSPVGAPSAATPASGSTQPTPEQAAETKPAEPTKIPEGETAVALNLENADLYQVLRIIAGELKINYIVDPAVKGVVTINTSVSVTRKDLFSLLQMILEINGAAAVKSNGYYAIVPLGSAKQQPLNFHFAKDAEGTPAAEDAFTMVVVPLRFISAAEISKILTPFMSPAGQIVVQDKGNIMIIVESAAKLAQLKEIINIFDDPVLGRQRVRIFPIVNGLAKNLVVDLKSVFAGYGLSTGASAIQFLPLDQQNAILAISASPDVFPEVEDWIKKLDQPAQQVGIRNFVYKVQNAKASDLANIIGQLYGAYVASATSTVSEPAMPNPGGITTPLNPSSVMGPQNGPPTPTAPAGPNSSTTTTQLQSQVRGDLRVMPDDKNNAVIIQASPHDYELVEQTLRQLDVLPRQVLIDARIYEVNLTGDLSLGLSAFLNKQNNLTPISRSGAFSAASGLAAQTFAILGNSYELQLFLTASENRSRVKTLSAPSILVTDNTTARIEVGSEVPVPIGSALTPVQSGGSSIFAQTIQFRDTGVILNVTPRINASGIVTLNIAQEVSSAQPNTTSAIVAPVITKSEFQTTAVLRDGQTLALGGIITTSNNNSRQRVPLIGDIPGLGLLFGNTNLSTSRKELVLLITPHVAQDMNEAGAISSDLLRSMRSLKQDLKRSAGQ